MRIEAYLRVLSDEARIRSFHEETNVPSATIKRLKAQRTASNEEMWWNWQTEPIPLDADTPDEGLRALLDAHRAIFPILKKYRGPETDVYVEMVTHYFEGEEPRGLYLSAETVQLLNELGAAFDNDIVVNQRVAEPL